MSAPVTHAVISIITTPSNITTPTNITTPSSIPFDIITKIYPIEASALSVVSCSLSIIGALVIFWSYWAIPDIRTFTRKLMICLTVADFLSASGYLVSVVQYVIDSERSAHYRPKLCEAQSVITTYSSIVSFFFTVIIALHIFLTVIYSDDRTGTTAWLVGFNLVSWIIPAVVTISALTQGVLGEDLYHPGATGPWCWVKPIYDRKHITWMFVAGKGWEVACYILTMSLYVLLKFYLYYRRTSLPNAHQSLRAEDKRFLYVWFVLYVIRIWGTVRFFMIVKYMDQIDDKAPMRALLYLQAFGDPLQAFCNCFLFCVLDKRVRRRLCRLCCGERGSEEEMRIVNAPFVT